jgi:hypothetical protein
MAQRQLKLGAFMRPVSIHTGDCNISTPDKRNRKNKRRKAQP